MSRTYAGHWEKPEWIYDQVLKIEAMMKTPELMALKARSMALYQQHLAKNFSEFFNHYTKIFFRVVSGKLNGPMLLMCLKQRQKMDNGDISWVDGNQEVIGASLNLLIRKLPKELQEKVLNTYKDLVDEERAEMKSAIEEVLKKNECATDESISADKLEEVLSSLVQAPQRIEVVSNEAVSGLKLL